VNGFGCADSRYIAVALIRKDDLVGQHTLDTGGHCSGSTVRRLTHVYIEIVIGQHSASGWWNSNCPVLNTQFIYDFTYQAVYDTVPASRAIMERNVFQ
jgi:hypothetical protein